MKQLCPSCEEKVRTAIGRMMAYHSDWHGPTRSGLEEMKKDLGL